MNQSLLQTSEGQLHYLISATEGPEAADAVLARINALPEPHRSRFIHEMIMDYLDLAEGKSESMDRIENRSRRNFDPVDIDKFIEDPKYLGKGDEVYPEVMEHLIEINRKDDPYEEAVLTGGIGTAKTTIAVLSTAYQLYKLASFIDPHAEFGLDRSSEIEFVFQSLDYSKAKQVAYARFKDIIDKSEFFRSAFPYNKDIQSQLQFENRIIVKPVTGAQTATIGENVYGGVIDEVNYMERVEQSVKALDGGEYDQANALYNSIARRRESRFLSRGRLHGLLFLVSSKRYPGQFTDQKEAEASAEIARTGKTSIYIYDKRIWDIKPWAFGEARFDVFIGDQSRTPRILTDDDKVRAVDRDLILRVPVELRRAFEKDIMEALREIGGISTLATHPFLINREAVSACFGKRKSILNRRDVELGSEKLCAFPERFENLHCPRWVHIDPSLTGDRTGLVIGHVPRFLPVLRGEGTELAPHIVIDASLRIHPPKGGEIQFWQIRDQLYNLFNLGLPIKWITLDSYQSRDFIQQVSLKGFNSFVLSLDTKPDGYVYTKNALYDNRIEAPSHEFLQNELLGLEFNSEKQRVDHPPSGSKDIADALAGVVWGLSTRTEIMVQHGVPLRQSIMNPDALAASAPKQVVIGSDKIIEPEVVVPDIVEVLD